MYWLVVGAVVLAVALAFGSPRSRALLLPDGAPGRLACGLSAVLLVVLSGVFMRVLVFDDGDNAYLFIYWVGLCLFASGLLFGLAAIWPERSVRRRVAVFAVGALMVLGLLNVALLASGLAIIPSQDYNSNDVFVSHLVALVALLAGMLAVVGSGHLLRAR